jgi:hypothetical protein
MGAIEGLREQVSVIEQMTRQAEQLADSTQWELGDIIRTITGL